MIDAVLRAGSEAGFSAAEVWREKLLRQEYENGSAGPSLSAWTGDRLQVRLFWESGEPLALGWSAADLKTVRRGLEAARAAVRPDSRKNFAELLPQQVEKPKLEIYDAQVTGPCQEQALALQESLQEHLLGFAGLHLTRFLFRQTAKKVYLANSIGLQVKYQKSVFQLQLGCAIRENRIEVAESRVFASQLNAERLLSRAYNLLSSLAGEKPPEKGSGSLIFAPEAALPLLRELAERLKGREYSRAGDIPPVASVLSVADHPQLDRQTGSVPCDDEGVQSGEKLLINKGLPLGLVLDLRTAFLLKRKPTGNGFRDERGVLPAPQFSNLYVKPSAFTLPQLMREAGSGVLVSLARLKDTGGAAGEMVFSLYGFQFSGEEIQQPVHFFLRTSLASFFASVRKVSKELRFFQHRFNLGSPYIWVEGKVAGEKMVAV